MAKKDKIVTICYFSINIILTLVIIASANIKMNKIHEIEGYTNIQKIKYCMVNLSDEQWKKYNSKIQVNDNNERGTREIKKGGFFIYLQTGPMRDSYLSKLQPEKDSIPVVGIAYSDGIELMKRFGVGNDITVWYENSSDKIIWDSESETFCDNFEVEERIGTSVDTIVTEFTNFENEMCLYVNNIIEDHIVELKEVRKETIIQKASMLLYGNIAFFLTLSIIKWRRHQSKTHKL